MLAMNVQRIALWSGPRNVSTALMYSFAQRADTRVLDEPLFGHFLEHTGVARPSRAEALAAMETNASTIFETQLLAPCDRPVLFVKHMANHLEGLPLSCLDDFTNVILTRHPADVITSYLANVETPTLLDLAYAQQVAVAQHLLAQGQMPIVLDSRHVLQQPAAALRALCQAIQLPFDAAMLKWEAGARPEDGVWANYWYQNVHKSTGFAPWKPKAAAVPEAQQALLNTCLPLYHQLKKHQLNIPGTDE